MYELYISKSLKRIIFCILCKLRFGAGMHFGVIGGLGRLRGFTLRLVCSKEFTGQLA